MTPQTSARRKLLQLSRSETMIVMQEVLARPSESEKPLKEQDYWTLELVDWTESWQPGFVVQQARVFWSEFDQYFTFDGLERERWPLLIDAAESYETRRRALAETGFVHSDIDL